MEKLPPITFETHVRNPLGFHGRVATRLFQVAAAFRSRVSFDDLSTGAGPIDAKSFSAILGSGASHGHRVRFTISGDDQAEAADALRALADDGFPGTDETEPSDDKPTETTGATEATAAREPTAARESALPGARTALPGAPGVAVGPIWVYRDAEPVPTVAAADHPIEAAAERAMADLRTLATGVKATGKPGDDAILLAQIQLGLDPRLIAAASERARTEDPATAVETTFREAAAAQAALPDERLAARASDFLDVGARIARMLRQQNRVLPERPSVVVADDLPPSALAEIPANLLLGVAMERGSATSHVVILARGRGIPAVVGVAGLLDAAAGATEIGIDGGSGEVVLDPTGRARAEFRTRERARYERRRAVDPKTRGLTKDGKHVPLLANVSSPEDAAGALRAGAEGVGLFRTEFLFLGRSSAPTEDEQVVAYREVFESFGPDRRVVIRLADLGGDKSVPYLDPQRREAGLAARDADLMRTQLRAIWRAAAAAGPGIVPHVMAPMVATLADAEQMRLLRDETRAAVAATTPTLPGHMIIGAMIERPEAVKIAEELAHRLEFFSIGTNDLTRLALGIERDDPAFGSAERGLDPAVVRLIARTVDGADAEGIPVAVCGELAANPIGALVLVALGVDALSMDASALDEVRSALARVTRAELDVLGRAVLAAPDALAVRARVAELLGR